MKSTAPDRQDVATLMLRIRYWQHQINEMLKRKLFKIPVHLAFGHEALAAALDACATSHDALCVTHRNVAYNLARTKSLDAVLDHLKLLAVGHNGALMGSMNLAAARTSISYASSVLGNNLPVAAGIAMNRLMAKGADVVFVLTGDGAMEEGAFWETLVFARSHSLHLVVIVENNDYSMSSTIKQRRSAIDLAKVCAGVDVGYWHARGAFVDEAFGALSAARASAAMGSPACVEMTLTTFNQHAGPTPGWPGDPLRIALEDGLIVKSNMEDPIFNLKAAIGETAFHKMTNRVIEMDHHE